MKQSIILAGSNVSEENWGFLKGVQDATGKKWHVKKCITNNFAGINRITRYIKFFLMPGVLFFKKNKYDEILSWQQFFGLILACYFRLFHVKNAPKLDIMTFIYKPKKGIAGRIYFSFAKYAVTSKYIRHIYVYSKSEINYYSDIFSVPKDIFRAVKLGIEDSRDRFTNIKTGEIYHIAPGRSNRDYDFLRAAWPEDAEPLYIVCDIEKSKSKDNITVLNDCFGDEYLRLLANAKTVVVPLLDENLSSGQLVFLQAAMMGKPVITTYNSTVQDYVIDGVTGLVIDKSKDSLAKALSLLDVEETYRKISVAARTHFESEFSLYRLGVCVGNQLK